jgi:DNA replication protein DnaD
VEASMAKLEEKMETTVKHQMKHLVSYVGQSTQNLRRELTETIENTQMELQTVEVSLDKRTRDVEENIAAIIEDITADKMRFQSRLEEVKAVAER